VRKRGRLNENGRKIGLLDERTGEVSSSVLKLRSAHTS
jgi:hypothetical protein